MGFVIEPMMPTDWDAVRAIYQEGIETGMATFETSVPSWEEWDASHLTSGRLVARTEEKVIGWAALTPVSDRCVYTGVAEVSVYIAAAARGQGVGKTIFSELIRLSEEADIWTLQASTFPENEASIALHQACGFRRVGRRERIGQLNGIWRDTIFLERRSAAVGVDR